MPGPSAVFALLGLLALSAPPTALAVDGERLHEPPQSRSRGVGRAKRRAAAAVPALADSVKLSNGLLLPRLGFGTAGGVRGQAVSAALAAGVRLIDTAQASEWYDETSVGEAYEASDVERSQVWITTKVHPRDFGYVATMKTVPRSLEALRVTYLDAILLHYPHWWSGLQGTPPKGTYKDSWRAFEKLLAQGKVRAIGISNVRIAELRELVEEVATKGSVHLVQNHFDPFNQDREVRAYCAEHDIAYQGYSTLGSQWQMQLGYNPVLGSKMLRRLAKKHKVSVAQVVLRWALDRRVAVIPKSRDPSRIKQNTKLDFKLSAKQMASIDKLDGGPPPR